MKANAKFHVLLVAALLLAAIIACASGATWSGYVRTESGVWYIERTASNLSLSYEQSVQGQISPVDHHGRMLSPYHLYYVDIRENDVRVRERTAALQGIISSEEQLRLKSSIKNSVNMTLHKPAGSDVYTVSFYERWPVNMSYSKSMSYTGTSINNREFVGNNQDYVGANFLYSTEFSKERSLNMSLESMNATVKATNEAIVIAKVNATRDTQYRLASHSTGIADIRWRQMDENNDILNAGEERFVGVYDITKSIRMKSRFFTPEKKDDWLPCCAGGWADVRSYDRKGFGASAGGVFNCTCHSASSVTQS
ncbi:MAG: hypothetical protein N3G75_07835 [Methanothrix sp.]|nr:hypothetical protein [Methanothrix sp.]MCX8207724.1 hypothetical protein [Methanothrix sp.]